MTPGGAAAAGALLCALAAAGCGLGPGHSIGEVRLTVTRDYGSMTLARRSETDAPSSETAMRLLDRSAKISTRYGGGFVQSIDGIEGGRRDGRQYDWFFYVNGVESPTGAADYDLRGDDRVWWDYRDWTAAMRVPAVVGSFPEPFADGYEGKPRRVEVLCRGAAAACRVTRDRIGAASGASASGDPIRVLVGPWSRLRQDAAAALIERGPSFSGVFAEFVRARRSWRLQPLDPTGAPAGAARQGGLVAATRRGDDPPTWLVTGTDVASIGEAARTLDPADLRDRYAVAVAGGGTTALPVQ